jgi:hypothetical protein
MMTEIEPHKERFSPAKVFFKCQGCRLTIEWAGRPQDMFYYLSIIVDRAYQHATRYKHGFDIWNEPGTNK